MGKEEDRMRPQTASSSPGWIEGRQEPAKTKFIGYTVIRWDKVSEKTGRGDRAEGEGKIESIEMRKWFPGKRKLPSREKNLLRGNMISRSRKRRGI